MWFFLLSLMWRFGCLSLSCSPEDQRYKAGGVKDSESFLSASFMHEIQEMEVGRGGNWQMGTAEPVCWKPTSFPVVSTGLTTELESMNLHSITQGHTNMSWFSQPHRPQHKDHPTMLESTVQLRKFYLILPSPYQFNTLVFLSFSKSLNFIQDPKDKLPPVTDPTLFLAFQVRKLRVIFNSSLPLTCISNLLS